MAAIDGGVDFGAHVILSFSLGRWFSSRCTTLHCGLPSKRGRERERAKCSWTGSMFHRAREIIVQPAESGRTVVLNWLTAKFNVRVCFSSFVLILRKSTPSSLLSSLECGRCWRTGCFERDSTLEKLSFFAAHASERCKIVVE